MTSCPVLQQSKTRGEEVLASSRYGAVWHILPNTNCCKALCGKRLAKKHRTDMTVCVTNPSARNEAYFTTNTCTRCLDAKGIPWIKRKILKETKMHE